MSRARSAMQEKKKSQGLFQVQQAVCDCTFVKVPFKGRNLQRELSNLNSNFFFLVISLSDKLLNFVRIPSAKNTFFFVTCKKNAMFFSTF